MNKLLIVLLTISFVVLAEETDADESRRYNTCMTAETAIKKANRQEEHYRNQLLFTLEKGTNSQRIMYQSQLSHVEGTRRSFEKIYNALQCSEYFDVKKK